MTVRPIRSAEEIPTTLRVISGGNRRRSRRAFLWALYTVGAVATFLLLIYLRTAIDESMYEIHRLENQISQEEVRRHQLHLEKLRLQSPDVIVPIAEHLLAMVLPTEVVVLTAAAPAVRTPDGAGGVAGTGETPNRPESTTADGPTGAASTAEVIGR